MPDLSNLEKRDVTRVALLGADYRNVGFEMLVAEGDRVEGGAAVMRDARRPDICFTAPLGGRVRLIERGPRRRLVSLQIEVDDDAGQVEVSVPRSGQSREMRAFMLANGCWSSLRTRPFGNLPDPESEPAAIFVGALSPEPGAPDAGPVIDACTAEFSVGLQLLTQISDAPIYVCHAPGQHFAFETAAQIRFVAFHGSFNAGLAGLHISRLCPIGFGGGEVWQLDYQEVIAFGHLVLHARHWDRRVVSLGGDAVKNPRSLLVAPGASIDELLQNEVADGRLRLLSGSELFGRPLPRASFIACGQRQLNAHLESQAETAPVATAKPGVVIPDDRLEAVAPPGIFPVPLMRALQLGDAERARQLGALELLEEDLVPLTRACASGNDYSLLLRRVLDQLEMTN